VNDGITLLGPQEGTEGAHHVVLDHVSVAWGEDEALSFWDGVRDATVQWSIVAEALDRSGHPKGGHSAGVLYGRGSTCLTLHHTLQAHDGFRNPLLSGGGLHDVVNNVFYDYGSSAAEVAAVASPTRANFVQNEWVPGPSTTWEGPTIWVEAEASPVHWVSESWHLLGGNGTVELFLDGNLAPDPLAGVGGLEPLREGQQVTVAFEVAPVTVDAVEELRGLLAAGAGATAPTRDEADMRVVQELLDGTGAIIDDPAEVGGWPVLDAGIPPPDDDGDGLPDDWEAARGLDPADPADALGDDDDDGYTNLEEWLHDRALGG
jgi:hypothetical protein